MVRVLVTGVNGQLARSMAERVVGHEGVGLVRLGRPDLDFETLDNIAPTIRAAAPDVIVNAAAYTDVDQAEDEPERAFRINAEAAGRLAVAARDIGARVIQISTDYVYDGRKTEPYVETDPTNPLGVYGASKLAGEQAVAESGAEYIILRTAWVYSPFGKNFVKSMLTLAKTHDVLRVVDDQRGCPTSALDLADAILNIIERCKAKPGSGLGEVYHVAGGGVCSWAEFAQQVLHTSRSMGGPFSEVQPIASAEWPTRVARPAYSVLATTALLHDFDGAPGPWRPVVKQVIARILGDPASSRGA